MLPPCPAVLRRRFCLMVRCLASGQMSVECGVGVAGRFERAGRTSYPATSLLPQWSDGWMTGDDFTISRPDLPEACYRISLPSSQRAQGMPGARCTRGLVCNSAQKMRTRAYRSAEASDIPCAMVLRLISCSPRRAGLRCHRRQRNCFHQLDASIGASGPHDLMSSRFFGLLKTSETPENEGFFRFPLDERKARRNPPGPDRP